MVAISLYRGNLHRASPSSSSSSEIPPRRWPMPPPRISPRDFRRLIQRRALSLSLLPSSSSAPAPAAAVAAAADGLLLQAETEAEDKEKEVVAGEDDPIPTPQVNGNLDTVGEKEKRQREIEEKLQILNEKKHNLVQALKQILNAEEELKRRSNVQANRPPLPLQVDASNDSGSMTRHGTPRAGSDVNVTADMEVGDDAVNHNTHPRQLLRMNSTSPSAESALRRPPFFQHNVASHPSRAAMVAAGSPSRFAPSGNQGQSANMPTVSVSGTNYIASSPSPAASGGTSCFRDARQPSPWS